MRQRTGKTVRIQSGDDFDANAAKMDPNVKTNGPAAEIKPFRPAHHNVLLAPKGSESSWRGLNPKDDRSAAKAKLKQQMITLGQATKKSDTAPVLHAMLNRAHLGMTLDPPITNIRFTRPALRRLKARS